MDSQNKPLQYVLAIAKTIGVISPAIYAGITFAYTNIVLPPLLTHASPQLLARQWLQAYQYGPRFVPPLIISGVFSNILLAYFSLGSLQRKGYIFAGLMTWSIIPFTIFYMEPGINGAAKWKVDQVLKEEGRVGMEENHGVMKDVEKHTGTESSRKWAEGVEMRDIVQRWGVVNGWRTWVGLVAAVGSGIASHCVLK